jgi:hypothetical protein
VHLGVEHMEKVVALHTADIPHTLVVGANKSVYLADHVVVTELTLEKPIVGYGNFPHWEVDTDSLLRSPFL